MSAGDNRSQRVRIESDLGPIDDRQPATPRRHRRLNTRIYAINIEDGEGIKTQARCFVHHVGGFVGALQESESAVCMQLRVSRFITHPHIISNICSKVVEGTNMIRVPEHALPRITPPNATSIRPSWR